jgi:primosomal protein N'
MIAHIIPALRMPRDVSYDYHIPKSLPAPTVGSLVRIRVHGRAATGLVVEMRDTSLVPAARIKDIDGVFANGALVITQEIIDVLPDIAGTYCTSIPLLLRNLVPNIPARQQNLSLPVRAGAANENNRRFSVVQLPSLFDAAAVRERLEPIIAQGPLLVLAPTKQHAQWLAETCADAAPVLYDGSIPLRASATVWAALLAGTHKLLIGTRSGVLAPLPPNGTIVLFGEEDPSFQQFDAAPLYDARMIARVRCLKETRPLTAFAEAPSVAMIASADSVQMTAPEAAPVVVSLTDERRAGFRGIFSDTTVAEIQEALAEKRDALICVNRKGTALALRCGDCFQSVTCATCDQPLRVLGHTLSCNHCGNKQTIPNQCPKCGSVHLRGRGLTIEAAVKALQTLFPNHALTVADTPQAVQRAPNPCILLGTEMLIHSLRRTIEERAIGAVIVPSAEQLFGSGYRESEEGYCSLRALQAIAERHVCAFVVQTYDPAHPVLTALTENPRAWYDHCIAERRLFRYPPSHHWVRLTVPHETDNTIALEQLRKSLPVSATVDEIEKNVYSLKFEAASELLPKVFQALPNSWRWQINPRT